MNQIERPYSLLTSSIRWSHSASDRNPLCRNALMTTRSQTPSEPCAYQRLRKERDMKVIGRSDRHLGRHESWTTREGSKAPTPAAAAGTPWATRRSARVTARRMWRWQRAMVRRARWETDEEGDAGGTCRGRRADASQEVRWSVGPDTWGRTVTERRGRGQSMFPSGKFQAHTRFWHLSPWKAGKQRLDECSSSSGIRSILPLFFFYYNVRMFRTNIHKKIRLILFPIFI